MTAEGDREQSRQVQPEERIAQVIQIKSYEDAPYLVLATRIGGGGLTGLMFFLSLIVLAPFAIGPDLNLLARIGPALLWIAALLSSLLGLDRLFQADEEDGSLDLLQAGPLPMLALVGAKCLAHWLTTGLPLALAAPVLGLLLALEPAQLGLPVGLHQVHAQLVQVSPLERRRDRSPAR